MRDRTAPHHAGPVSRHPAAPHAAPHLPARPVPLSLPSLPALRPLPAGSARRARQVAGHVVPVLLGSGIVLTTVAGLAVGWFNISFQLFGESPSREDYQVAAGAFALSALVLVLGGLAVGSFRAPRWQTYAAATGAALLVVLALRSAAKAAAATDPGPGLNGWQDGAVAVLACPWTWPLLVLGFVALVRGDHARRPASAGRSDRSERVSG